MGPSTSMTKKNRSQLRTFMASSESVKDIFKQQALKQPKLELLDKVLCKCLQQCILMENP